MSDSPPPTPATPAQKVTAVCSKCRTRYTLPADAVGRRFRCRTCSMLFSVYDPHKSKNMPDLTVRMDSPVLPEEVKSFAGPAADLPAKFAIETEVGRGAFGSVFKAFQNDLARNVAIKLLHTEEGDATERFQREARIAAGLSHPNIVPIFEVGEAGGKPYVVMEFVDGQPLHKMKIPVKRAVEIIRDAANAIGYAHERGIIHRDVKPQNIMVSTDRGRVYVMDFGLARSAKETGMTTAAGMVLGTPAFMSPEQAEGAEGVEAQSDVYSLGSTLYFLLTERPPYDAASPLALLKQVHDGNYPPIRGLNPEVPEGVTAIVAKAMARKPEDRYQNATEMATALEAHILGSTIMVQPPLASPVAPPVTTPPTPPPKSSSKAPLFGGIAAVLLLGIAAVYFFVLRPKDGSKPDPTPTTRTQTPTKPPSQPDPFGVAMSAAREALESDKPVEALQRSAEALKLKREDGEARALRVRCLVAAAKKSAAAARWSEVEEWMLEADGLAHGDPDITALLKQLEASKKGPDIPKKESYADFCFQARQALEEKRYEDALLLAAKALHEKPGGAEAIQLRLKSYMAQAQDALAANDLPTALIRSADALKAKPDQPEAKSLRVRCLIAAGKKSAEAARWTEVEELLKEATPLAPEDAEVKSLAKRLADSRTKPPDITPTSGTYADLYMAATRAFDEKRYSDVLSLTEKALKEKPGGAEAVSLRRRALGALAQEACAAERWEDARDYAKQIRDLVPDDKDIAGLAAWTDGHLFEKSEKWKEAGEAYDVAARTGYQADLSKERSMLCRARVHLAGRQFDRVESELEPILKNAPGHKEANDILTKSTLAGTHLVVLYSDSKGLHLADLRTGKSRVISAAGKIESGISWSAKRRLFAFIEQEGGKSFLATADSEGQNVNRVGEEPGKTLVGPDWSPDGERLALAIKQKSTWELVVYDASSWKKTVSLSDGNPLSPRWAADSQRLAYWSESRPGVYGLSVQDVVGRGQPQKVGKTWPFAGLPDAPEWSGDGKWILFAVAGSQQGLYMAADKSLMADRIGEGKMLSFAWSPDGKRLAFSATSNSVESVSCLTAEGDPKGTLSKKSVTYRSVQWSPDSILIGYFCQEPGGKPQIRAWSPDRDRERLLYTFDEDVKDARLFWWASE